MSLGSQALSPSRSTSPAAGGFRRYALRPKQHTFFPQSSSPCMIITTNFITLDRKSLQMPKTAGQVSGWLFFFTFCSCFDISLRLVFSSRESCLGEILEYRRSGNRTRTDDGRKGQANEHVDRWTLQATSVAAMNTWSFTCILSTLCCSPLLSDKLHFYQRTS